MNHHLNDPEILQHVIYNKVNKDHSGYSPLHTCNHDTGHVQLRRSEDPLTANSYVPNQCHYETRNTLITPPKDNVVLVQPCMMSNFSSRTTNRCQPPDTRATSFDVLDCTETHNQPDIHTVNSSYTQTLKPSRGQNVRSFYDRVYSERPGMCGHRGRLGRNPRNVNEPKPTRVLYTLNNSF